MSTISEIFKSYESALSGSRDQYTNLYAQRAENGRLFYEAFFKDLIFPFADLFNDGNSRSFIGRQIERFFGTTDIDFVAIDGTCQKDPFNDFIVFFGGAYGAKGQVSLKGDPPKVRYHKWEMNRDVSMVAWVPVPFAQLSDVSSENASETFVVTDADRINLAGIHTSLMQLAEIYLAYNVATGSSIDSPRLIMLDQSLSGLVASAVHGVHTGLVGYPYDRRQLDARDVYVAFAHPFSGELRVPSAKKLRRYTAILAVFHARGTRKLSAAVLEGEIGVAAGELDPDLKYLEKTCRLCTRLGDEIELTIDVRESWEFVKSLFQNICSRLFLKKDQSALMYDRPDPDDRTKTRRAWMSPDDINFLIAVGIRGLVEVCWEKRILLIGVVKDSESRYLTRNYLGVCRQRGLYPVLADMNVGLLPWTDRIYLETIPTYCDDALNAPWASIEFDSTFMTLHLGLDDFGAREIMGVRVQGGEMVAPERLFVRSLAQFYLNRSKKTPLAGHVVFIDRLAYPAWDKAAIGQLEIESPTLGKIRPIVFKDKSEINTGQVVSMYLLSVLTKNHFPEVIGYPDPLHKADWGAKSVGRRVKGIIQSSELPFRSKPISRTLRSIRDGQKR